MNNYKTCKLENIIADAKGNAKKTNFLKELVNTTEVNAKGETNPISYVSLKRAYYKEFYNNLLPVAKKKPTMLELISAM